MKLIKKTRENTYCFGTEKDDIMIQVYKREQNKDKDFDPEYWCSLIENAEEMKGALTHFKNHIDNAEYKKGEYIFSKDGFVYNEVTRILDRINKTEKTKLNLNGKTYYISKESTPEFKRMLEQLK